MWKQHLANTAAALPKIEAGLIDKGEVGLALYGLLFVIVVLATLLLLQSRSLSNRDQLIAEMMKEMRGAASEQSQANLAVAVQLSAITATMGAKSIGA